MEKIKIISSENILPIETNKDGIIISKNILNLNDCPLNTESELKSFFKKYGSFDILLTQFSYAAWKGGKNNKNWREDAAQEKISAIIKQCEILKIKNSLGNTVAHTQVYQGWRTNDLEILNLQNDYGFAVAHIQAIQGWTTDNPEILNIKDQAGITVKHYILSHKK